MVKTAVKFKTDKSGFIRIGVPTVTGMNLNQADMDDKSQMGMITFLANLGKFIDKFNEKWGEHEEAGGTYT